MSNEWANAKTANAQSSEMWDEKGGKPMIGQLISVKHDVGANASTVYNVRDDSGEVIGVWGATVLDGKMEEVPINSRVKIEFLGMKTNAKSGRTFKDYDVQYIEPAESAAPAVVPTPETNVPEIEGEPIQLDEDVFPSTKEV